VGCAERPDQRIAGMGVCVYVYMCMGVYVYGCTDHRCVGVWMCECMGTTVCGCLDAGIRACAYECMGVWVYGWAVLDALTNGPQVRAPTTFPHEHTDPTPTLLHEYTYPPHKP